MARENQGLQAAVIVLVIAFLLMLVGLVLDHNAYKTQRALAESNATARDQAKQQEVKAQTDATALKEMAGFAETDTMEAIREAFDAEMGKLEPEAEGRKYRVVLGRMAEEIRKLVLNNATATEDVKKLKERLLAVETQKEEQVKKFEAEMEKARQDLASERQKFEGEYTRITTANKAIQKEMDDMRAAHEKQIADLDKASQQSKIQIDKMERTIETLRQGVPNPDQFAQPADGLITSVDQLNGTVYVNIGSEDGLRPQVTFAVAEAGLEDAAAAKQKGSIEITKILGPHTAEGRITKDTATDPLLPNDRIFSQVWDRGRQVGIAIAGFVDLNKDGKSDLEKLKAIVAASGGVVDAAPDDTGKQQGELKVSTRYLVLGEYPNDARLGELRKSWTDLSDEAEKLGVETISVDEFLSLMGWRRESRSVGMGPGAPASDFPPTARTQEMPRRTGQSAPLFKPRLPSTAY